MPMRSFTLPSGLKNSHLEQDGGVHAGGDAVELHERSAPDGFDDVVIDAAQDSTWLVTLSAG